MSARLENGAGWEATVFAWLHRQLLVKAPQLPASLRLIGQAAIVSGANSGLGFECCRQLLQAGLSHLVLAVRSDTKGNGAASQLRSEFPQAKIDVFVVDMGSYDSIFQFTRRCDGLSRLDMVILNAGVMMQQFERNPHTGHETTLQVNYLSTALLAILMCSILRDKRHGQIPGRLTVVGSDMSLWASLPDPHKEPILQSFDNEGRFTSMRSYTGTKLMDQFFVTKLAMLVSPDDVIINLVNPGFCAGTSLGGESSHPYLSWFLASTVARSTTDGAKAYVDALVVKGKESHGSYISNGMIKPYPKIMYSPEGKEFQDKLWEETLTEFAFVEAVVVIEKMGLGKV